MTLTCHELTTTAGKVELAYLGEKPWHGLGQQIPADASIEQTQIAAGMNWNIKRADVKFDAVEDESVNQTDFTRIETRNVDNRVVLYRSDNFNPLGVVSAAYKELQPAEVLGFFRDMVEAGGYEMESAGTMRGGARMFAAVKVSENFELPGGDQVAKRLLLATACDGTMATVIKPMSIRVVCRNTLNAAMGDGRQSVIVRHSSKFDAKAVQQQLARFNATFAAFQQSCAIMAARQVTVEKSKEFLTSLLPAPTFGDVDQTRGFKAILKLFDGAGLGADMPSARGTMWGLLNAVTQYVDHEAGTRNAERRTESALFGPGSVLKARALELATA